MQLIYIEYFKTVFTCTLFTAKHKHFPHTNIKNNENDNYPKTESIRNHPYNKNVSKIK